MEKLKIRNLLKESFGKPHSHQYYFTADNTFPYINDDDIEDTYIYKDIDDELLHNSGLFLMAVLPADNKFFIVRDRFYNMIEKEDVGVADFLFYHEVGHCRYRHLEIDSKKLKRINAMRCIGFLPKIEKEADLYATSKVGKRTAIRGLYFLMKNTDLPILCKVESFKRIINVAFA